MEQKYLFRYRGKINNVPMTVKKNVFFVEAPRFINMEEDEENVPNVVTHLE